VVRGFSQRGFSIPECSVLKGKVIIQPGMLGVICKNQCMLEKSRIFVEDARLWGI
jgi:hypothetical protein